MQAALRSRAGALALLFAASTPAHSHHSFAQVYFESQLVTIQGEVVEFQLRSPHAWLYVTVRDEQGAQRYGAEWSNPFRLERDGVAHDTFQPGDQVSITGSPGRDAEARQIHLKKVTRFSRGGWSWSGPQRRR
jgi:hypothetical protein